MFKFLQTFLKKIEKNKKIIYLTIIFIMGLTPIIWFIGKNGLLINGVDINFPLDPKVWITRRIFMWNNISNAGSDYSYAPAGLFFHFIQFLPFIIGLNLQLVQIFSLVFWFLLIVFTSYIFAKTIFPKKYYIQLIFVNLYCFNTFLFNTWENVKVANLSLVAAIPLGLAIFISLHKKNISYKKANIYLLFTGIILSGAGINPAYFFCFFLSLFFLFISFLITKEKKESFWLIVKNFFFVTFIILLVNSFWIFPTIRYVISEISFQGNLDKIGFSNWIDSLSKNSSLINVIRMQGAWDWYAFDSITGMPFYIPYALNYFYRFPFIVFSFLVPFLAFFSFFIKDDKKKIYYLFFGLIFIIGVFLGAGTHPPTGVIFNWLINHIPLFSLFRSPWYIFTPMVSLSTAGLVSLFFNSLEAKNIKGSFLLRKLNYIFAVILLVGNLLYSYPLITGKIFRPNRNDSFYISFPSYVFEAGDWLQDAVKGRILVFPDDNLESFNWGYKGVEPILSLLINREFIFPSFNITNVNTTSVVNKLYENLRKGKLESVENIMSKLKISYILEHKDQQTLPFKLTDSLNSWKEKEIGMWSFYKNPISEDNDIKVFSANNFIFGYPFTNNFELLSVLKENQHLINPEDEVIQKIPNINLFAGSAIISTNSQKEDYQNYVLNQKKKSKHSLLNDFSFVEYTFFTPEENYYSPILESYSFGDVEDLKQLSVNVDGNDNVWSVKNVSDSYIYFEDVFIKRGEHKVTIKLDGKTTVLKEDFQQNSKYEINLNNNADANFQIFLDGNNKYLKISNNGKIDVSAKFVTPFFDSMNPYHVSLDYKSVYGNTGACLIGQETDTTLIKTQAERLLSYPDWVNYGFYYEPVKADSQMTIELVAPFIHDPFGTMVYFDNLKVNKVFVNDLIFVNKGKSIGAIPEINIEKVSPVEYAGKVIGAEGPHFIIFSENYSPEWGIQFTNNLNEKIDVNPLHFSTDFYSNAWYVEGLPSEYNIKIYYKPQKLFNFGVAVSLASIIIAIVLYKKNKK